VQESIFNRIRSERSKIVSEYQSEGELQASRIKSAADEKVRTMDAEARSKEAQIRADADIAANTIRNQAYGQDPEFYSFLKQMETMQSIFGDNKSMLLLSTDRPMFKSMFQPPRPQAEKKGGG
jgi:membrane protease subunit HflC